MVGTGNEVAITQAGDGNFASYSQIGNFNRIGSTRNDETLAVRGQVSTRG